MDRPDETSGLSAAPDKAAIPEAAGPGTTFAVPRPLPAYAIQSMPEAAVGGTEIERAAAVAPGTQSADAVFAAIDAEAALRSLSAADTAISTPPLPEAKSLAPGDVSIRALPLPPLSDRADLGDTIPRRMFEPRFETAPLADHDRLQFDAAFRSDAPPVAAEAPKPARSFGSLIKRGLKIFAWLAIGWLALVLVLIVAYRFVNPPASMLMLQYWLSGEGVSQHWVPLDDISPNVVRAVIVSEDGRFCQHAGVDLEAIEDAIENSDGRARGGSTISMQVVKNLFLWPSKSYVRKALELPLTFVMELVWPKRRIMEVYLNIAEWGRGVFGVEAAAQYHFGKAARNLTARDAARLAVSLPNPLVRNAGRPGPGLQRLAGAIQSRMRLAAPSQLSCVLSKRAF